ncbi:MAG: helix-hairpin-helix domain-containing protein [Iphinoe sp. HA4291-MV1]|jgi:hypothetical protein|nr:helix-hairpin-helix domain-containing protein [Iphinoe sp. HA4291-MV1]
MIDPSKPVRLLKHVSYGTDFYQPREYQPGELPAALLISGVVSQVESRGEIAMLSLGALPGAIAPIVSYKDAVPVQEMTMTPQEPAATALAFGPPSLPVRLQVNQATIDELSKLPGVGTATAMKLIAERDKGAFTSLQDLSDRISLPRGKWEDLRANLLFD